MDDMMPNITGRVRVKLSARVRVGVKVRVRLKGRVRIGVRLIGMMLL
jgi:hypothetical protein